MYGYVGALSGDVINMFWNPRFPVLDRDSANPYLLLLLGLGVAVPLILKRFAYNESSTLFVVLLLFIYTSAVPLPDYLLWIYPLGVLIALTSLSRLSFTKRLLLTGLPLYVGLFFISSLMVTACRGVYSSLHTHCYVKTLHSLPPLRAMAPLCSSSTPSC
jgi:hypothetical protein